MVAKNRAGVGQGLTNNRVRNAAILNSGGKQSLNKDLELNFSKHNNGESAAVPRDLNVSLHVSSYRTAAAPKSPRAHV